MSHLKFSLLNVRLWIFFQIFEFSGQKTAEIKIQKTFSVVKCNKLWVKWIKLEKNLYKIRVKWDFFKEWFLNIVKTKLDFIF